MFELGLWNWRWQQQTFQGRRGWKKKQQNIFSRFSLFSFSTMWRLSLILKKKFLCLSFCPFPELRTHVHCSLKGANHTPHLGIMKIIHTWNVVRHHYSIIPFYRWIKWGPQSASGALGAGSLGLCHLTPGQNNLFTRSVICKLFGSPSQWKRLGDTKQVGSPIWAARHLAQSNTWWILVEWKKKWNSGYRNATGFPSLYTGAPGIRLH